MTRSGGKPLVDRLASSADFARSLGCFGESVDRTEDFGAAFERAAAWGLSAVVTRRVDAEAISPGSTIPELREGGR
jgi:acetolactate synthase I/II/III large subunit